MNPEATTEAAPAIEAVPEPVADSPQESAPEQAQEFSIADAYAEAQAELAGETESPAQDPPAESTTGQEGEAPSETAEPAQPEGTPEKPETAQGALQRIQTLVDQGRESELTAIERGVLNKLRTKVHEETQQQETFRETYLDLLNKESDEPEAFTKWLREDAKGPDALAFMREYARLHPDVSLEHPTGKAAPPSREALDAEIRAEYNAGIEEILESVATDAGVSAEAFTTLKGGAKGLGSFLGGLVTEAAKAEVAKQLPGIRAEERKAAELEAQATYANRTIIAPRVIGGAPQDPNKSTASRVTGGGGVDDWRAALEEAKEEFART